MCPDSWLRFDGMLLDSPTARRVRAHRYSKAMLAYTTCPFYIKAGCTVAPGTAASQRLETAWPDGLNIFAESVLTRE